MVNSPKKSSSTSTELQLFLLSFMHLTLSSSLPERAELSFRNKTQTHPVQNLQAALRSPKQYWVGFEKSPMKGGWGVTEEIMKRETQRLMLSLSLALSLFLSLFTYSLKLKKYHCRLLITDCVGWCTVAPLSLAIVYGIVIWCARAGDSTLALKISWLITETVRCSDACMLNTNHFTFHFYKF